ncbi:hypothetical protein BD410DRAFT_143885 [Rickenella mellea]|uniref:Uncharacterized protein n=1 Tax=Rickenella mellea TaxID=50990 RepID=A0A4Y7Q963_9AGAM|nr:hypothetical protein BD410DRAFT_143885 [Rickenella mellea]
MRARFFFLGDVLFLCPHYPSHPWIMAIPRLRFPHVVVLSVSPSQLFAEITEITKTCVCYMSRTRYNDNFGLEVLMKILRVLATDGLEKRRNFFSDRLAMRCVGQAGVIRRSYFGCVGAAPFPGLYGRIEPKIQRGDRVDEVDAGGMPTKPTRRGMLRCL